MGYVTCGLHEKTRCCWRCDRCPTCDGIGRLQRGDYCRECTRYILAHGGRWNPRSQDYDAPRAGPGLFDTGTEPDEIDAARAYEEQTEEEVRA